MNSHSGYHHPPPPLLGGYVILYGCAYRWGDVILSFHQAWRKYSKGMREVVVIIASSPRSRLGWFCKDSYLWNQKLPLQYPSTHRLNLFSCVPLSSASCGWRWKKEQSFNRFMASGRTEVETLSQLKSTESATAIWYFGRCLCDLQDWLPSRVTYSSQFAIIVFITAFKRSFRSFLSDSVWWKWGMSRRLYASCSLPHKV